MIITLNYQRIQLSGLMPGKYEGYRLPGARLQAWEGRSGNVIVQEVPMGRTNLLYLLVLLTERIPLQIHLPQWEVVFAFGIEGDWLAKCFGKQVIPLPPSTYNLFFNAAIQLTPGDTIPRMCRILLLETGMDFLWNSFRQLKGTSLSGNLSDQITPFTCYDQSMQAGPVMVEAALQLIQSSYFPEPRYFHHNAVARIFAETCTDCAMKKNNGTAWSLDQTNALELVRQYIHDHMDTHHSLEGLSRYCGMNREQLRQGFKNKFGKTVFQYLSEVRLDGAKILLIHSHQTLKEIAGRSGYRNVSNFTTAFKRYTGQTPAVFRKTQRENNA